MNQKAGPHEKLNSASSLILDSPAVKNKCLLFKSLTVYGIFVIVAQPD